MCLRSRLTSGKWLCLYPSGKLNRDVCDVCLRTCLCSMNTNVKQHTEFSSKSMWAINKIALPYCTDVTSLCPTGCCSAARGPACRVCVCVWHSYLQLGEYFLDVAEAALRDVHVLFVRPSLEDGLGGVREVLVEGEVCSHGLHFDFLALFRPDFTHVLFPARYDL